MNPEAEAAVTERFQQSKARLRNELQDQLQSRMEQLDEEHSTLEYVRNKAEISALEAKVNKAVIVFSSLRLSIKQSQTSVPLGMYYEITFSSFGRVKRAVGFKVT